MNTIRLTAQNYYSSHLIKITPDIDINNGDYITITIKDGSPNTPIRTLKGVVKSCGGVLCSFMFDNYYNFYILSNNDSINFSQKME